MDKLISQTKDYAIYLLDRKNIMELATFVVEENYIHHKSEMMAADHQSEIDVICEEEEKYKDQSEIYVVRDNFHRIIGSIRVFLWNHIQMLPMEKIFGINPAETIPGGADIQFWHIGRFAIKAFAGISTLTLFKQLMGLALRPVFMNAGSCMIAETDSRLLKVVNMMGIKTTQLGEPVEYLASKTVPIYSNPEDMKGFYDHYGAFIDKHVDTQKCRSLDATCRNTLLCQSF